MFGNLVEVQRGHFVSVLRIWDQGSKIAGPSGLGIYRAELAQDGRLRHTAMQFLHFGPGVPARFQNRSLLEDPRLTHVNDTFVLILQGADFRIKLAELSSDLATIAVVRQCKVEGVRDQRSKNVAPLIRQGTLFLVWMMDPLIITECSDFCASECKVVTGLGFRELLANSKSLTLRGGSDWVPVRACIDLKLPLFGLERWTSFGRNQPTYE